VSNIGYIINRLFVCKEKAYSQKTVSIGPGKEKGKTKEGR